MTTSLAEVSPPGKFIADELNARGWSRSDFAEIIGKDSTFVSLVISGKRAITLDTAQLIGEAFGTSAQMWMNMEARYRLSLADGPDQQVARRAHLYSIAPVRHMVQRQWIDDPGQDPEAIESSLKQFYDADDIDGLPPANFPARKSTSYVKCDPSQRAWFWRAKKLAPAAHAKRFVKRGIEKRLMALRDLVVHPADVRRVASVLSDMGIRLLYIEHLPKTKIDGAAFWLNKSSPVVVLSLRYGRLDAFWFTLCHELGHIILGDEEVLDDDLVSDGGIDRELAACERAADDFAESFLVPQKPLKRFIRRQRPYFSKASLMEFSRKMGVHPAIVVGQLQHRGEINYAHSREMLVQIRDHAIGSGLTDGWGHTPKLIK